MRQGAGLGRLPLPPFKELMRWARRQTIEVKDATEASDATESENTEAENSEAENPEAEKKRCRSRATRGKYTLPQPRDPRKILGIDAESILVNRKTNKGTPLVK